MANEKRLIDADALCDRITATFPPMSANAMYVAIENAPTVDAVEVVHGRWEKEDQSGISIDGYMVCSACNVMIPKPDYNRYCLHRLNFCPNCGAKMDLKGE